MSSGIVLQFNINIELFQSQILELPALCINQQLLDFSIVSTDKCIRQEYRYTMGYNAFLFFSVPRL